MVSSQGYSEQLFLLFHIGYMQGTQAEGNQGLGKIISIANFLKTAINAMIFDQETP